MTGWCRRSASSPASATAPRCAAGSADSTRARTVEQGRRCSTSEMERLGVRSLSMPPRSCRANSASRTPDALYVGLGEGELTIAQVAGAIQRTSARAGAPAPPRPTRATARRRGHGRRQGSATSLSTIARCCRPVPPGADPRLHHARARRQHPPRRLRRTCSRMQDRDRSACSRSAGVAPPERVPGRDPRRGVRPARAGARHLLGAGRRAHQHRDDEHG